MPAPPLVVPNAVQVRLLWTVNGQSAVNVLAARKAAGLTVSQGLANLVGAAIKGAFTSVLASLISPGSGIVAVGLRDLTAANQTEYLDTGAVTPGTGTGEPLPASIAENVTLRTALSGKSKRGRVYIPGFTEASNDIAGVSTQAAADASVAFIEAVKDALSANNLTMAVLSRPAYSYIDTRTWTLPDGSQETDTLGRGLARPGGLEDVTEAQVRDLRWESQRRRNNGRGSGATAFRAVSRAVFT